ncbi:MAG: hypothetical protein M3Y69_07645 [Verrucomicrobiota bacterium]|nr:hypothetical protein [Verrucomicrobiota bacterium]
MSAELISISDLPTVKSRPRLLAANRECHSSAVFKTKDTAGSLRTDSAQAEWVAQRAIEALLEKIERGSNVAAAKALVRFVEGSVTAQNDAAHRNPTLFRTVAASRSAWPVMQSDLKDEQDFNCQLIRDLQVGRDCPLNTTKQRPGGRQRRYSDSNPLNALAACYGEAALCLYAIRGWLLKSCGKNYLNAAKTFAQRHGLPPSMQAILCNADAANEPLLSVAAMLPLIWQMISLDACGTPERIKEVRGVAVSRAASASGEFARFQASHSHTSDNATLMHLKRHVGTEPLERAIRAELRTKVKQSLQGVLRAS